MATTDNKKIRCSFCGRTQDKVDKLIAGNGAFICNECVKLCLSIMEEEYADNHEEKQDSSCKKLP